MSSVRHPVAIRLFLKRSVALAVSLIVWAGVAPRAVAERPVPDPVAGKAEYLRSCARCHGVEGAGDGPDAKRFYPRPRDFREGIYKFRSTVSGTPPMDDDLFLTITRGLPGSNMPDWEHLDEAARWQLVYYIKSFSTFFEEVGPELVEVAGDPGSRAADLSKGKAVYKQMGCAACHGDTGRANGASAAGFVDDWNMPIRPADLAHGWNYRGGSDPESIMMRFLTGIDGTGMPSYAGAVTPEDAWHLAYYVVSQQEPPHWNRIARAAHVHGALPESLDDPRWDAAERTDVRLRNVVNASGEWVAPPTVTLVSMQVLHDREMAAFRLSWNDPSEDREGPADAFALLFSTPESAGDVVTLQAWPYAGAPSLDICYWTAETGTAHEEVTSDFERVRANHSASDSLESVARYEDGRWEMLLRRALTPLGLEGAAEIATGGLTAIAFAVWDGGNAGERAVSPWVDVALRSVQAADAH